MVSLVKVVVSLISCWSVVEAVQFLNLDEGDICKQGSDGTLWTCKHHRSCKGLRERIRQGQRPSICGFRAPKDPVICCEPQTRRLPSRGAKSREMCSKYAEYVYHKVPKPLEDGYLKIDTCAAVEPLIVGGNDTVPKEFPHMALIGYGRKGGIKWFCGGSLVSERYVISAAHCTNTTIGPARWVRLGEWNMKSTDDERRGYAKSTEYEIIERIDHPEYKPPSYYNDITLYKLNKDVAFNEFIRPLCLQVKHQFAKSYAIASGWGYTEYRGKQSDILQKVNLTITPRKTCSDVYKQGTGPKLKEGIRDESMLCAGGISGTEKDTCQGDSGGPLQLRLKKPHCMYSLVGITSFGSRCGGDIPAVYTRVSNYIPWIESIVWS